jgi:hypothetical protein
MSERDDLAPLYPKVPYLLILLSFSASLCLSYELPLTPAPIPDCSALQLDSGHFLLQPSLAHIVCGYAELHNQISRGDAPLRALVFSPGKHQLGNRVLELSSIMLLCMCSERALYVSWSSPSPISRHAQPVSFDWRLSSVSSAHGDILRQSQATTRETLLDDLESSDITVLYYNLELGDYLLRVLQQSTCSPIIHRYLQVIRSLLLHPPPLFFMHLSRTFLEADPRLFLLHRGYQRC